MAPKDLWVRDCTEGCRDGKGFAQTAVRPQWSGSVGSQQPAPYAIKCLTEPLIKALEVEGTIDLKRSHQLERPVQQCPGQLEHFLLGNGWRRHVAHGYRSPILSAGLNLAWPSRASIMPSVDTYLLTISRLECPKRY